jgi:hypothetical protein
MTQPSKIELSDVRLSAQLVARVDTWAAAHEVDRAKAIERLVELALKPEVEAGAVAAPAVPRRRRDDVAIEALAASQIAGLIDPGTPEEERERRIHRLTEGPPEFVRVRIDLPGRQTQ